MWPGCQPKGNKGFTLSRSPSTRRDKRKLLEVRKSLVARALGFGCALKRKTCANCSKNDPSTNPRYYEVQ